MNCLPFVPLPFFLAPAPPPSPRDDCTRMDDEWGQLQCQFGVEEQSHLNPGGGQEPQWHVLVLINEHHIYRGQRSSSKR